MATQHILRFHYDQDPDTNLRGVDPGIYHLAQRVDRRGDLVGLDSDTYWALDYEGAIDGSQVEVHDLYQCSGCQRYFRPGDTYVTGNGDEYCYADNGNGCKERYESELWAPPKTPRVAVEPSTYRVVVRMNEWRNVWVTADNPVEAKRLVLEEDWFGPEFVCESETTDIDTADVECVERLGEAS